jgi:hypothetical protein
MATAEREDIDRSVFKPLVMEAVLKAFDIGPSHAQTGPAIRNDKKTMEKHIDLLSFSDDYANLYKVVSDSISKQKTSGADE